jgi:hypothetical protein
LRCFQGGRRRRRPIEATFLPSQAIGRGGIIVSSEDGSSNRGTAWTLGAIKARNLTLDGHCRTPGCGRFFVFEVDGLIATAGADYVVPEILPGVACTACGGDLKFMLGSARRDE